MSGTCTLLASIALLAATQDPAERTPTDRTWAVAGEERHALVVPSAAEGTAPVVFVFHGHGGTGEGFARRAHFEGHWPEAIVVYPEGLPTPGRLTDPEGKKAGWQGREGDQGNRDLAFFDAMLASLIAEGKADPTRVYATGHSNGGGFTYLLWRERGDRLAAVAPSAAAHNILGAPQLPCFHLLGTNDPLVKPEWQRATFLAARDINRCAEGDGRSIGTGLTKFDTPDGPPCILYEHEGGHSFAVEAVPWIMRFFQAHRRVAADSPAAGGVPAGAGSAPAKAGEGT